MENISKLREAIKDMLDQSTQKSDIEKLSTISTIVDSIEADTTALKQENKELLSDYKEMIKHYSFERKDNPELRTGEKEAPRIEDFFK